MKRRSITTLLSALAMLGATSSFASENKLPIRILVGFVPGGNSDVVARMLAEELRHELGRNVLVENKPGAGGRIAAEAMNAAPADGTTYLFSPDSWAVFPTFLYTPEKLRYNYKTDMQPVARVISFPLGLYAGKKSGAKNLKEFVEKAKKDPSLSFYAASGAGSISEFLGLVMSKEFGVKMELVPYKGSPDVKNALMGSQAAVGIMSPVDKDSLGDIIPLAYMTEERWSVAPDIPTMKEQGYNVVQGNAFMGLWTSARTPVAERLTMEQAVRKVLNKEEFRQRLIKNSISPDFATGDELKKQVEELIDFWEPLVKESGFKP